MAKEAKTSMLAKVVKQQSISNITPFQIPEVRTGNPNAKGQKEFSVPSLEDIPKVEIVPQEQPLVEETTTEEILQKARDEAAQILEQAERDSEMIEQAAREKALQEVEQKIAEGVEEKLSEIRESFAETIDEISSLQKEITNRVEQDLVELSLEIAKKIVGREVTVDPEIALTLVKVSLKKLDDRTDAKIHLHPDDFAYVSKHRENLEFRGTLELIEDKSISLGGCLIETETGDIDARIESQFEEIAHGLLDT